MLIVSNILRTSAKTVQERQKIEDGILAFLKSKYIYTKYASVKIKKLNPDTACVGHSIAPKKCSSNIFPAFFTTLFEKKDPT